MNIVQQALDFALWAHSGQKRKYGDRPYIYHPKELVSYLRSKGYIEENLLAAGYLHDTLEDCSDKVSYNTLQAEFGIAVADLVREVSKPPATGNRNKRWQIYLQHYENAFKDGKILKLADRVVNLREYIDFWPELPREAKRFLDISYLTESIELSESLWDASPTINNDLLEVIDEIECLLEQEGDLNV